MSRFSNSKVYKLINSVDSKIYVGSTTQPLSKRLMDHKNCAKNRPKPVHRYLNTIGWGNVRIVLIENVECLDKEQLIQREQHWIDSLKPELNRWSAYIHCPHRRRHRRCKNCNGSQICIHNKHKPACRDCSPKHCECCDITINKNSYKRHTTTKGHIYNFIHYFL